jgi:ribosomal protein S27AE
MIKPEANSAPRGETHTNLAAQCNTTEGIKRLVDVAAEWKNRACPECGAASTLWKVVDGQLRCGPCGTLLIAPLEE